MVTSIRMNLGGRPGRLPGPNLLFPRPRPLPLALQSTMLQVRDKRWIWHLHSFYAFLLSTNSLQRRAKSEEALTPKTISRYQPVLLCCTLRNHSTEHIIIYFDNFGTERTKASSKRSAMATLLLASQGAECWEVTVPAI